MCVCVCVWGGRHTRTLVQNEGWDCLITTPPFYLYLASQRRGSVGDTRDRFVKGFDPQPARVTCDYRSGDLNEYTIFGPFAASLCGAGNSQSAVYPIIAPCLYASLEQLGVQLLC